MTEISTLLDISTAPIVFDREYGYCLRPVSERPQTNWLSFNDAHCTLERMGTISTLEKALFSKSKPTLDEFAQDLCKQRLSQQQQQDIFAIQAHNKQQQLDYFMGHTLPRHLYSDIDETKVAVSIDAPLITLEQPPAILPTLFPNQAILCIAGQVYNTATSQADCGTLKIGDRRAQHLAHHMTLAQLQQAYTDAIQKAYASVVRDGVNKAMRTMPNTAQHNTRNPFDATNPITYKSTRVEKCTDGYAVIVTNQPYIIKIQTSNNQHQYRECSAYELHFQCRVSGDAISVSKPIGVTLGRMHPFLGNDGWICDKHKTWENERIHFDRAHNIQTQLKTFADQVKNGADAFKLIFLKGFAQGAVPLQFSFDTYGPLLPVQNDGQARQYARQHNLEF